MNVMNQSQPLVSVVLPTYNRAHLLAAAVGSVLQQTYANLELIVVDDNSPDDTSEVIHSFDDVRLKYVKNEVNLKLPGTLNAGFSHAKGDYLTWTSDDNLFAEQAIEKMVETLQKGQCDFAFADYFEFSELDGESNQPMDSRLVTLPDELDLKKGNQVGACFLYTRKAYEAVGDYNTELFLVEDYDYWIRIAELFQICHIAEPLYFFRRDEQTLYYSRFCEVKISDFLVRYKNKLLNRDEVVGEVVKLIESNLKNLKNIFFRSSYSLIRKVSFRLEQVYINKLSTIIHHNVQKRLGAILVAYDNNEINFISAKQEMVDLVNSVAFIQPK